MNVTLTKHRKALDDRARLYEGRYSRNPPGFSTNPNEWRVHVWTCRLGVLLILAVVGAGGAGIWALFNVIR